MRAVALAALLAVSPAFGADEAADPDGIPLESAAADFTGEPTRLDDVIITATKRDEAVRSIAGSVSVQDGGQLERLQAREQADYIKRMPGVTLFQSEPNQNRVGIRGIIEDYGTSQAIGTLIDDVPFTDPFVADQSPDLLPFDLDTVEILKGPQGTLFGASGLGGALRYVLRPAQLDDSGARAYVGYDRLSEGETAPSYGAAVNMPLVEDALALRVVAAERRRPGSVDETGRQVPDTDRANLRSYRGSLRYVPAREWDVQLLHLVQDTRIEDLGFVDNAEGRLTRDSTPTPSPAHSGFALDTLRISHALPSAELVSLSGRVGKRYSSDTDASRLVPATRVVADATVDGYTQEFRIVSSVPGSRWRWLAGVFLLDYDNARRVDLRGDTLALTGSPTPGVPFVPGTVGLTGADFGLIARYDLDASAREHAVFGEVTRLLGSQWDVSIGLRGYRTESSGVATASGALNLLLSGEQESRNDASTQDTGLNPKISLRYRHSDDLMLYALASRGFRFGGVSLIADTRTDDVPATYRSDTLWLYEAGVRSDWLSGALATDLTLFRMDWSDPQITQLTDSGLLTYTDNVGGARMEGAEAALEIVLPWPGVMFAAGAAYNDARTTEAFVASSGDEMPSGTPWPFAPRTQVAASIAYDGQVLDWPFDAELVYARTSKAPGSIENTYSIFDYATLDLHAGFAVPAWGWLPRMALAITNILDVRGIAGRMDSGDVSTIYYVRPRTLSIQATVALP